MIYEIGEYISELDAMSKYPKKLFYIGNKELLKKRKVSIVGSRRPINYVKNSTFEIASKLSQRGICIVSGAAMGVDALSHRGAGAKNTIAVMGNGLDIRYPTVNKSLIESIEKNGLTLSQFENDQKATPWSFVQRNEIVVALGEVLIVTQADMKSGSMRSVEFAQKMGKKIYVLPHRIGESDGTNYLLEKNMAEPIYDIDSFADMFGMKEKVYYEDEFTLFCKTSPSYDEAVLKFGEKIFEAELEGSIVVKNGKIIIV